MATQTAENPADYWERLTPILEAEYGERHVDDVAAAEIIVYDDRENVGQSNPAIRVQFRTNGPVRRNGGRRRRTTTFNCRTLVDLDEVIADLQGAREALEADRCDECEAMVPSTGEMANHHHAESCSLHEAR